VASLARPPTASATSPNQVVHSCIGPDRPNWFHGVPGQGPSVYTFETAGGRLDADLNTIDRNGTRVQQWG
jgi:hypothetical protein